MSRFGALVSLLVLCLIVCIASHPAIFASGRYTFLGGATLQYTPQNNATLATNAPIQAFPTGDILLSTPHTIHKLTSGRFHTVILTREGRAYVSGVLHDGALGWDVTDVTSPRLVSGASLQASDSTRIKDVFAGYDTIFFIDDKNVVHALGYNKNGALCDGTRETRHTPVLIKGAPRYTTQISSSRTHTLILDSAGGSHTCGDNEYGQLGVVPSSGASNQVTTPQHIHHSSPFSQVSAGDGFSLFLEASTGRVLGCGLNMDGQLGIGGAVLLSTPKLTLVAPSGPMHMERIKQIYAGSTTSHFVSTSGEVYGCGDNSRGVIGDGTTINRPLPVRVNGVANITHVATGSHHALFLDSSGIAYASGHNADLKLGVGEANEGKIETTPTRVAHPGPFIGVSLSQHASYFLQTWKCDGILHTNASACSGHGICAAQDTCNCAAGWRDATCKCPQGLMGADCNSIMTCFGVTHNSTQACSSHGQCVDVDKCTCNDGFHFSTSQCLPCPVGNKCINDERILCEKGTFSDTEGSTTCQPCPSGFTSSAGASKCTSAASLTAGEIVGLVLGITAGSVLMSSCTAVVIFFIVLVLMICCVSCVLCCVSVILRVCKCGRHRNRRSIHVRNTQHRLSSLSMMPSDDEDVDVDRDRESGKKEETRLQRIEYAESEIVDDRGESPISVQNMAIHIDHRGELYSSDDDLGVGVDKKEDTTTLPPGYSAEEDEELQEGDVALEEGLYVDDETVSERTTKDLKLGALQRLQKKIRRKDREEDQERRVAQRSAHNESTTSFTTTSSATETTSDYTTFRNLTSFTYKPGSGAPPPQILSCTQEELSGLSHYTTTTNRDDLSRLSLHTVNAFIECVNDWLQQRNAWQFEYKDLMEVLVVERGELFTEQQMRSLLQVLLELNRVRVDRQYAEEQKDEDGAEEDRNDTGGNVIFTKKRHYAHIVYGVCSMPVQRRGRR